MLSSKEEEKDVHMQPFSSRTGERKKKKKGKEKEKEKKETR